MFARIKSIIGMTDAKASALSSAARAGSLPSPREPTPLPYAEPPTAPYPIECLTPKLRCAAVAIMNKTQGPAALAAQSVLWVTSLVAGSRVKVETLGSPSNATACFITIALSGERKSAADEIAKTGVDRVILRLRAEYDAAFAQYKSELASLGRGEDRPPAPVCPSFLVTEPTIEGAFKAIDTGCGFLGWTTDEGAAFLGGYSMAREQRGKTSGILSKWWDGSYSIRPRAGKEGDGYVPPIALTLSVMFQPHLVKDTFGDAQLITQGFLPRILSCWPQSNMGNRMYKAPTREDEEAVQRFHDEVEAALIATLEDPTERLLPLSDDARTLCVEFHDKIEATLCPGGWAADISGFASKAREHACRLAALMTLFEDRDAEAVSVDVMESACKLVKYYMSQFKYLCIAATNQTDMAHAQKLLEWLRKNLAPGEAFATDKVLQYGPVHARQADPLKRMLRILMEYGWVDELPNGTMIGGRRRRKAYRLSPRA